MAFPSWRYHHTDAARLVADQTEADALGEDWSETPYPGGPTTATGTPLEILTRDIALRYWETGEASKAELYLIGDSFGVDLAPLVSVEDMELALEDYRPE